MFPGMNQQMMKQAMKKMGMKQEDLDAKEVIIRLQDRDLIIRNPSVSKINMQGQETFQIVGKVEEKSPETNPDINEEDIKTVMEQANVTEEEAKEAIEESKGDLAEAIISLKK
ncbi:MAG: nascent polypeptide-associated complex protein [Nanoarchaeota archaeon]|nr:nascent polypeptide-associated complex protein [Nanoarchaeota archaeon]